MSIEFKQITVKEEKSVHHQPEIQKEGSHYQCLSTTNREEPEQFMNASKARKQETDPKLGKPEIYVNIAHAKKEAQPNAGRLSQEKRTTDDTADTDKDAADVTPAPAVLSHRRAMDILKTYIKAEPVTKRHRNAAGSDTESDTSDFAPAFIHSPHAPQQNSTSTKCNAYINTPPSMGKQSSTINDDENSPETGDRKKSMLFSIVVCCVLVVFLVFALLLMFVGLNRSELMKNQAKDSHSTAASNMLIMNLIKQVRDLEESLNQSNAMIQNLSNQNQLLSSSIDSHRNTLQSHVTDYRALVSTSENNHDTLTANISGNYADLNNQINTLQGVVNTNRDSANSQISQLQSGINLETRCNRGTAGCTVSGGGSAYQLSCSTLSISRISGVSHTCQQ